jgi:uncharacterized membrane protein
VKVGRDVALVGFDGINSAAETFAAVQNRSGANAPWAQEVGFVEHHDDGRLVLRGTFARRYLDVDEALHVSDHGAAEGWGVGAALGYLLGPPAFAVGMVTGAAVGSQIGAPSDADVELPLLADRLRAAVPRPGSSIVLIAEAGDVDAMVTAFGGARARVMRRTLTDAEGVVLDASLSAAPPASPGISTEGEQATERSH